jgi:subtilase family serine protease
MFNDRVSPSTYWSASNGANYASVLSYIPEVAWNENGSSDCSGGCGILSTGGGVSAVFAKPVWQTGLGVPADGRRDVPDVALTAAAHDAYLLCTPGFCSNGFASSSGSVSGVAGTSASAPAFAGMLALVIQKTGANIGNANPYLYALANSAYAANVYHDITSGDNKVPCTAGSTNCPSGGSIGYTAGVGYDPVTGLGSVVASQLVTHWGQVVPVGTPGTLATTATLTATSLTGVVGGSDSFTITIGPSAPNVVAPTGSVSYIVNGTNYAYQALTSSGTNGTSSITFTMNAASYFHAGQNTVQVLYLGDATYASSQSNILTINLATQGTTLGNFTMTASQSAVTVAAGATTPPVTMTLTSTGYTGALNFSVTNPEMTLNACYTFTPTSVTLASSTATATAIFSLSTSCSSSNSTPVSGSGQNLIQSASNAPQHAPGYAAGAAVLLSVLLFFGLPRRRRWAPLLAVLLALASFGINGCGSGGSSVAGSGSGTIISSRGIYTIVLTATGTGNVTQSASFKLTVQ